MTRDRHDADDLVQATIERALRRRGRFRVGTNLRAWLARILRNLFIDGCRHKRGSLLEHCDLESLPGLDPESSAEGHEFSHEDVEQALAQVPQPLRSLLDGHLRGGMSYRALGHRFAIPIATVGTRLFRGRKQLRTALLAIQPRTAGVAHRRSR